MSIRQISRGLKLSRNSVRQIIRQQGQTPQTVRSDKIQLDPGLVRRLHKQCKGQAKLVHEKLTEEEV